MQTRGKHKNLNEDYLWNQQLEKKNNKILRNSENIDNDIIINKLIESIISKYSNKLVSKLLFCKIINDKIKFEPDFNQLKYKEYLKQIIGNKTINEWYKHYIQLYFDKNYKQTNNNYQKYDNKKDPKYFETGFKDPIKNRYYLFKENLPFKSTNKKSYPNSFPYKENKKYQLHHVSKIGTYQIDLFFSQNFCYLNAIEVNSRYLFSCLTNITPKIIEEEENNKIQQKSAFACLKAMQTLFNEGWNPKIIKCDSEKAFGSKIIKNLFLRPNNIQLIPVKRIKIGDKTYPMHNSLSLIDRVSRTIRDMAYNLGYQIIFPELMLKIIYIYNHSPHNTLSKLLNRRISPIEIYQNKNLQNIIIQKLNNQNKKIFHQNKFLIPENTLVNVYNEKNHLIKRRTVIRPDLYKIINIDGTMYKLQNVKNNEEIILPRYKIKY